MLILGGIGDDVNHIARLVLSIVLDFYPQFIGGTHLSDHPHDSVYLSVSDPGIPPCHARNLCGSHNFNFYPSCDSFDGVQKEN